MAVTGETDETRKFILTIVLYHQEKLEAFLDLYRDFFGETLRVRIKPDVKWRSS
jgi:hypothetical protein